jgi:hypothetical protein
MFMSCCPSPSVSHSSIRSVHTTSSSSAQVIHSTPTLRCVSPFFPPIPHLLHAHPEHAALPDRLADLVSAVLVKLLLLAGNDDLLLALHLGIKPRLFVNPPLDEARDVVLGALILHANSVLDMPFLEVVAAAAPSSAEPTPPVAGSVVPCMVEEVVVCDETLACPPTDDEDAILHLVAGQSAPGHRSSVALGTYFGMRILAVLHIDGLDVLTGMPGIGVGAGADLARDGMSRADHHRVGVHLDGLVIVLLVSEDRDLVVIESPRKGHQVLETACVDLWKVHVLLVAIHRCESRGDWCKVSACPVGWLLPNFCLQLLLELGLFKSGPLDVGGFVDQQSASVPVSHCLDS